MPPAARIGDMRICPLVTGVVPHVGGPIDSMMYFFSPPSNCGAVRPAAAATSANEHANTRPDGFGRGLTAAPRPSIPWPQSTWYAASSTMAAIDARPRPRCSPPGMASFWEYRPPRVKPARCWRAALYTDHGAGVYRD